jgi:hypothetical protein
LSKRSFGEDFRAFAFLQIQEPGLRWRYCLKTLLPCSTAKIQIGKVKHSWFRHVKQNPKDFVIFPVDLSGNHRENSGRDESENSYNDPAQVSTRRNGHGWMYAPRTARNGAGKPPDAWLRPWASKKIPFAVVPPNSTTTYGFQIIASRFAGIQGLDQKRIERFSRWFEAKILNRAVCYRFGSVGLGNCAAEQSFP